MERLKVKAKTKTKITPKDLIEFCSKEVDSETVFEKINHIYDELNVFIDRNKLVMNNDELIRESKDKKNHLLDLKVINFGFFLFVDILEGR